MTKGNTLKQGDKTPLKYRLFDADGEKLNIAGKSAQVRLVYPDFLTIGYEKNGLTVAQDDTVTFTIDKVIPAKLYHVEIIVDDKFVFPSRADESKFTVDKSSLGTESSIIEIVGVDAVVKKAVELINKDPNLIIDEEKLVNDIIKNTGIGSIEEYYQQFSDVITELSEDKDYHSLPEIAGARGGFDTLGDRLNDTTVKLAQKVSKNSTDLSLNMFNEEDRAIIQGLKPGEINAVLGVGNVKSENIGKGEVAEKHTRFASSGKNLFDGVYHPVYIGFEEGGVFKRSQDGTTASAIVEVEPNTTYTITKGGSNRFVVAASDAYPAFENEGVGRFIRRPPDPDIPSVVNSGFYTHTFTTNENENYIVIYVSAVTSPDLPREPLMMVEKNDVETLYEPYSTKMKNITYFDKDVLYKGNIMPEFTKGKNLFDGIWEAKYIGWDGVEATLHDSSDGLSRTAILPITGGTKVTISRNRISDRFIIAYTTKPPVAGMSVVRINTNEDHDKHSVTVDLPTEAKYLIIATSISGTPPSFMQVEYGELETSWESFGYNIPIAEPFVTQNRSKSTPEYYGAVGDANYINHVDGTVWVDSNFTIPATDDTQALNDLFNSGVRAANFDSSKQYLVTSPINISPKTVRKINGNNAVLIANGDFDVLNVVGNLTSNSGPISSPQHALTERSLVIDSLRITSATRTSATAIRLNKNFGTIITNCDIFFVKNGIKIDGNNRNLIIANSHIWAADDYGIWLTNGGDLHQFIVSNNQISYCRKNIFSDNHALYNAQINNNDIESDIYPSDSEHDIHIFSIDKKVEDLKIVGNTIEDHWATDALIKLERTGSAQITAVAITGNVIGNSRSNDVHLVSVENCTIGANVFKQTGKASILLSGSIRALNVNGNTFANYGGGVLDSEDLITLTDFKLGDNVLSDGCNGNPIVLTATTITNVSLTDNQLKLSGNTKLDNTKGMINITASEITLLRVQDNNILNESTAPIALKITAETESGIFCKDNMASGFSSNPYVLSEGVLGENIIL